MADTDPIDSDREARTSSTFVALIDTLVDDFDVIDLLTVLASRCVELLDASAAGILLGDTDRQLRVMAASTEQIALLELFQIQNREGPCMDCYCNGTIVAASNMYETSPWPSFARESIAVGFPSVCAVPLRLRAVILGCLNLFMSHPRPLSGADVNLAQALADVASIAIVQDQAAREAAIRERQLQRALDSRVLIEQAKGMLAEHSGLDMDGAFAQLRAYARRHNRRLADVADALVTGKLPISSVAAR